MENYKINMTKIIAAGNNFKIIGFTMILGIIISLIQVGYTKNIDISSASNLNSIKVANNTFITLYIVCTIIIIWNFISAGIYLSSSTDEAENPIIESEVLAPKLNLDLSRTGELSEGGIIVYSNENDSLGLVCSRLDLGKENWNDARKLCEGYNEGGFSDWRLPNKDELLLIYSLLQDKKNIGNFSSQGKIGYWCSNDIDKKHAVEIHFGYGKVGFYHKTISNYVRAVRSF